MNSGQWLCGCVIGVAVLAGSSGAGVARTEPPSTVTTKAAWVITLQVMGEKPPAEQIPAACEAMRARLGGGWADKARFERLGATIDLHVPNVRTTQASRAAFSSELQKRIADAGLTQAEQEEMARICREIGPGDSKEQADLRERVSRRFAEQPPRGQAFRDAFVLAAIQESSRGWTSDPNELARGLVIPGILEFRMLASPDSLPAGYQISEQAPPGTRWIPVRRPEDWVLARSPSDIERGIQELRANPAAYFAKRKWVAFSHDGKVMLLACDSPGQVMTQEREAWGVKDARINIDELGRAALAIRLDDAGAERQQRMTEANLGRTMAIVIDGRIYAGLTLVTPLVGTQLICGTFTDVELRQLQMALKNPLYLDVKVVEVRETDKR